MDHYFAFIILAIVLVGLNVALKRHRERKQAAAAAAAKVIPPAPLEPAALSSRLHELEALYSNFASASAHPRELAENKPFRDAAALLAEPTVPLAAVMQYALGVNWTLACAAYAALANRSDRAAAIEQTIANFDKLPAWTMYFALELLLAAKPRPPVGAPVIGAKDWWRENPTIPLLFEDYFERRASDQPVEFGPALYGTSASSPAVIRGFLSKLNHPLARQLQQKLDSIERSSIDRAFLTGFGRFWDSPTSHGILVEPDVWQQPFAAAESTLRQSPRRSLLVSGEPQVGKTAFLRLLALRLAPEGWSVFDAGGADLMAGQQWFGQLEGRIRQAVEQLAVEKKLIWYIPDLLQLARSGTHQGQSASILDQILPAIVAGRLVVWTEATPTSVARLLQMRPALRGIFEVVRLEPQTEEQTTTLALALIDELTAERDLIVIDPGCAQAAVNAARQYLSASSFPGSALQLIRLTAGKASVGHITPGDVVNTLSQLTGLPVSILDTKERLDLAAIRDFFSRRSSARTTPSTASSIASPSSKPGSTIRAGRSACSCSRARPAPARLRSPRPPRSICSARRIASSVWT